MDVNHCARAAKWRISWSAIKIRYTVWLWLGPAAEQTQRMYFRRSFSLTSNQTKLFEMRNIKRHGCFGPR